MQPWLFSSVPDPDPHVFGPPGSGSFYHPSSFLLASWRSMTKTAGSWSASGSESESGSISQWHGSADRIHTKCHGSGTLLFSIILVLQVFPFSSKDRVKFCFNGEGLKKWFQSSIIKYCTPNISVLLLCTSEQWVTCIGYLYFEVYSQLWFDMRQYDMVPRYNRVPT